MPDRRPLSFDRLDEVPVEVDRLIKGGHRTVGRWTLAQICTHLAASIRLTIAGAALASVTEPPPPAVERARRIARQRFFRSGTFPDGVEMPTEAIAPGPADADPKLAAEALREAIARFLDADGPFPIHPYLGPLDRDEWLAFHRIHCGHHLGFAHPTKAGPEDD